MKKLQLQHMRAYDGSFEKSDWDKGLIRLATMVEDGWQGTTEVEIFSEEEWDDSPTVLGVASGFLGVYGTIKWYYIVAVPNGWLTKEQREDVDRICGKTIAAHTEAQHMEEWDYYNNSYNSGELI